MKRRVKWGKTDEFVLYALTTTSESQELAH